MDNAFKDALVMKLPALRATLNFKDLFALFTQQVNNGIYQDQNKCVLGGLRQRLVKIVVGRNKRICVVQTLIHHLHRLTHSRNLFFCCSRRGQGCNLSLKNLAHFNEII